MGRRARIIAFLGLSLVALASCHASSTPAARSAVMAEMRPQLDRVRRAEEEKSPKPLNAPYLGDASKLVGATEAEISSGLGRPMWVECEPDKVTCRWKYAFYYLPSDWIGGGQEFVLFFDADGIVIEVEKLLTQ